MRSPREQVQDRSGIYVLGNVAPTEQSKKNENRRSWASLKPAAVVQAWDQQGK